MKIFDTHAHYDDEAFDKDRDELLTSLFSGDIGAVVNVGASLEGCIESVRLAEKYENIYAAIGVHPDDYERLERGEKSDLIIIMMIREESFRKSGLQDS